MSNWIAFWDSEHPIYVNNRHRDVHYRAIADDERAYIATPGSVALDYGCGEALHAERVAEAVQHLVLCDAAPTVRAGLIERFGQVRNILVRAPDEVAALPEHSFDLVVLHSVSQYLSAAEADALFALFHRLLKPSGLCVVGDVVPPQVSPLTDALALLGFGARKGFFIAAVLGLVRTVFSDYPRLRSQLGLTLYDEASMIAKLSSAGFTARRASANIGHNQARMTFVARPR
jgi:SAM-dependent methyltransferase